MFAVQQQKVGGALPFNLNVEDSMIRQAVGGVAFSNVGGVLRLDRVSVIDSSLMAAVSTGGAGSVGGMTVISATTVTNSAIMVRIRKHDHCLKV
jgi:hypothetical protein